MAVFAEGDGVGDDHLLEESRLREALDRRRGEDGVGGTGQHLGGAVLPQQAGAGADGAAGVDHVVDHDRGLAGHIADHREALGHVVARAALVDDRQRGVAELLGEGAGPGHTTDVRGDHHDITEVTAGEVIHQHR